MSRYESSVARAGKTAGAQVARILHAAFGGRARGRAGILCFHRVSHPVDGTAPPLNVPPDRFREQLGGLSRRGYRFVGLRALVDLAERGEPVPPKSVVITFDDGYANVRDHAWPVLEDLRIPATIFLASAFIDSGRPFPFDPWAVEREEGDVEAAWLPLSWSQCREMQSSDLITVGTHTHTHRNFRGRPAEFEDDLRTSIEMIAERMGRRPDLFSFPFGGVTQGFAGPDLAAVAERLGLRCGLTTEIELVDPSVSPFRWGRIEASAHDSGATLAAKLEGWYAWMGRGRDWYRMARGRG